MIYKIVFQVSNFLKDLKTLPQTREDIMTIASQAPENAIEAHIMVGTTDSELDLGFEMERIELVKNFEGTWRLQYVPVDYVWGVFQNVHSTQEDALSYKREVEKGRAVLPRQIFSCEAMDREGLGPLARMDTRPGNEFPVMRTEADALLIREFVESLRKLRGRIP